MKLKSEFKNKYNKIHYRIYELDNGINVIHLENPTTINFDFSIVIKEVLKDFKGSIISISHDRKFLKEVCDEVYRLDREGMKKV